MNTVPALVTLTFWGVPRRHVPTAMARYVLDRRHLRRVPGMRFSKLLGTGDGRTFTLRDADLLHWGLLASWEDPAAAAEFAGGTLHRRWAGIATEHLEVRMVPVASRGQWSRRQPFGSPTPRRVDGPVASITRARLRASRASGFWRAVPPVSADLNGTPGLVLAIGIGEAPIGLQGTFSLWRSAGELVDFAHRRAAHAEVVRRTEPERWYVEELFARFAVESVTGTFAGHHPDIDQPAVREA